MNDGIPTNRRSRKSTVALYSDDLRYSIIQEVFKRPALWDNTNHELASVVQRKEFFEEISSNLKLFDNTLTATVVEKQWKNLKDTFNKVKKKSNYDENGKIVLPKWRFYNAMVFIDQNSSQNEPNSSFKPDINRLFKRKRSKPAFSGDESIIPKKIFKSNSNIINPDCGNVKVEEKSLFNSTENILPSSTINCDDDLLEDETYDRFWGIWFK